MRMKKVSSTNMEAERKQIANIQQQELFSEKQLQQIIFC